MAESHVDLPQPHSTANAGILDVAHAANVSTATVSRALRGLPRVSPETRQRVLAAARKLGYVTSSTASALATGRTRIVGVLTLSGDELFNWRAIQSVARELNKHGYALALFDLNDFENTAEIFLSTASPEKRCDGFLILGGTPKDEPSLPLRLARLPLVTISSGTPGTGADGTSAITKAVSHLLTHMNTVGR